MKPAADRMNGIQVRRPCGCYATDDACECDTSVDVDLWLIAGEDVNMNRLAETRAYRQSKFRNRT